jgi:hypothetical protein
MAFKRRAVLLTILLCVPGIVRAQSAYGPGGLFLIPSGLTPPAGSIGFGAMAGYQDMWAAPVPHEHLLVSTNVAYSASDRLQVGMTNIVMRDVTHSPSWGPFAKLRLAEETRRGPALAISGVWIHAGHWRTEAVFLSATKSFSLTDRIAGHVHAGAMHATWMNGINTNWHPYNPRDPEAVPTAAQARYFDPSRAIIRQAPFAGIDIGFGEYVKVTAEARYRIITDHPDSIPGFVGIVFAPHPLARLGFAMGSDGLGGDPEFKIGVGYNISTLE